MIRISTFCHMLDTTENSELSPKDALLQLVAFEFGCRGLVREIGESSVSVLTPTMSGLFSTKFEGSQTDMQPLVDTAFYFQRSHSDDSQAIDEVVERLGGADEGHQAYCRTMMIPLLLSSKRLKVALMLGMGVVDHKEIEFGCKLPLDDLCSRLWVVRATSGEHIYNVVGLTERAGGG